MKLMMQFNRFKGIIRELLSTAIFFLPQLLQFYRFSSGISDYKNIFLFPFYHIGGADKVHLDIVKSVSNNNSIVFFTHFSKGNTLKSSFELTAEIYDIGALLRIPILSGFILKRIAEKIERANRPVVFGCNTVYFYKLLAYIPQKIKCLDLIHGLVHSHESGPEHWSIDVIGNLHNRIVISQGTFEGLKNFYIDRGLDVFSKDIILIENFVDCSKDLNKNYSKERVEVVFIGRNSPEKRVHLIEGVIELLDPNKFSFTLAGPGIKKSGKITERSNIKIYDQIESEDLLQDIYNNADAILITSSREGFPLVLLEGMSNGVVPICTNVGGISWHINEVNNNGFLVENKDEHYIISEIVKKLLKLEENRSFLEERSKNAYNYAKNHFSKSNFEKSYSDVFK